MGVHKRGGKFIAQYWDPTARGGKGGNKQLGTFTTQKEAKAALAKSAERQPPSATTVAQWHERWMKTAQWNNSTRHRHEERSRTFVLIHGNKRLSSVDRRVARDWIAEYPSSHQSLSAMFAAALYEDNEHGEPLLKYNPFAKLVKRTVAKRDLRADWLPASAIDELEAAALKVHGPILGQTLASMIRFAYETGVRPGELYVMEEDDLDVKNGKLWVRRSFDSKTGTLGPPKNKKPREVVLSDKAAEAARKAVRWDLAYVTMPALGPRGERLKGDEVWLPRCTRRLFSTRSGKQWRQPAHSVHWSPIRQAAGRPGMDWYELRHACATRLLELGLRDDEVAVQLGHDDGGELVRKVYGHPNQRRALGKIRDAMGGGEEKAA